MLTLNFSLLIIPSSWKSLYSSVMSTLRSRNFCFDQIHSRPNEKFFTRTKALILKKTKIVFSIRKWLTYEILRHLYQKFFAWNFPKTNILSKSSRHGCEHWKSLINKIFAKILTHSKVVVSTISINRDYNRNRIISRLSDYDFEIFF